MARVALVTGGTRGIGESISKALKDAGYTVAATYGGNDEAAAKFKEETGIAVYKWDVGDFEACEQGVAQVEVDLGPIDVLVNNAGITRDSMLHKMSPENWRAVITINDDHITAGNIGKGKADTNHGGNFHALGDNGSVAARPTDFRTNPQHKASIEIGYLTGGEVVGKNDNR